MRTFLLLAALLALTLVDRPAVRAWSTRTPVRLVDLVRSSTVMVVSPKRINAAQQLESSIRTTWHVFQIEETLSKRSDGSVARTGLQSCIEKTAPGIVAMKRELALPFIDIEEPAEPQIDTGVYVVERIGGGRRPDWIPPEMGRRYLLMATDCDDGTARLPIGTFGLFEIDAAGNLTSVGAAPDDFEHGSLTTIRELIADLARYDADTAPSGLIAGQILDAVTNRPVAAGSVRLSGVDEREVRTTDDGWFVFRDVRAFTYDMAVSVYGWVGAKQRVRVGASERRADVSVSLHRLPGIHGVLREENGRPIPMVWVSAAQVTVGNSVAWNKSGHEVRTDDRGRFSFSALEPGEYLLYAYINPLPEAEPDERTGLTFYPSSFYPAGTAPVDGTPVSLRADDASTGIDIVVRPVPMRRATGVVRQGGAPVADAVILVGRVDRVVDPSGAATFRGRSGRTAADGTFHFADLPPGEHVLTLMGDRRREPISKRVDVTRGDVADVTFDIPGMPIGAPAARNPSANVGTARIEGVVRDIDLPAAAFLARTRVTVRHLETRTERKVQTDPRGTFHIGRLAPGRYELLAERDGFVAVTPGNSVHVPPVVTVGEGGASSASLMMRRAGVVSGVVYDEAGKPVAGYHVTLRRFTTENGALVTQDLLRQYKVIGGTHNAGVTDDDGRYRIFGVPPGEYGVAAVLERTPPSSHRTTQAEVSQALADVRTKADAARPGFVALAPPPAPAPARTPRTVTGERLPVYHPGTVDPLSAARVRVEAGAEVEGVNIVVSEPAER